MFASHHDSEQEKLNRMVNMLADDPNDQTELPAVRQLQQRSKKTIGMATGGAIGSVVPGVGSLLGALIGYSLADSRWVATKVDQWLTR
jgi:hypothetical protein